VPAHKLQGKLEFQGLPISVENRKGSVRHWHDPATDKDGTTKMLYPYGYIKGTLGIDGDAVDVFVGPDESTDKVYLITQTKAPDFKEIDEQKVFLGFKSSGDAKAAYLKHYNNPKFFHSIKEMSMEAFKGKLTTRRGKLIKSALFLKDNTGMIWSETMTSKVIEELDAVTKALTAAATAGLAQQARAQATVQAYGTTVAQPSAPYSWEAPLVPAHRVHNELASHGPARSYEVYKSCDACGTIVKSDTACKRCVHNAAEAPVWGQ